VVSYATTSLDDRSPRERVNCRNAARRVPLH
jgi:hypothetical protein